MYSIHYYVDSGEAFDYTASQPANNEQPFQYPADDNENDFNDFEEDAATKRIREEEERIQGLLK